MKCPCWGWGGVVAFKYHSWNFFSSLHWFYILHVAELLHLKSSWHNLSPGPFTAQSTHTNIVLSLTQLQELFCSTDAVSPLPGIQPVLSVNTIFAWLSLRTKQGTGNHSSELQCRGVLRSREQQFDKHGSNYEDAKLELFFTFLSRQITPELVL